MKDFNMIAQKIDQLRALSFVLIGEAESAAEYIEDENALEAAERLQNLLFLLGDELEQVKGAVNEVNGNIRVCNAIQQSTYLRKLERENAELKQFISDNIGEVAHHGKA